MNRISRSTLLITAGCVLCFAAGMAFFMTMPGPDSELTPMATEQDLSHHPIYSTYQFSPPEGVVRIGIQPFWVYGANIAEAMRHDRLLSQELSALGLRAEFYSFLKGPDINFFMVKGHLDVGMSGYLPTLQISTLQDILVPSIIDQNFYDVVAVNCPTINDLGGRTIGFPPGSDAHHALMEILELIGIKAKLVPMDVDAMPEAIRDRRIDACVAWNPITSLIISENSDASVVYRKLWTTFLYFRGGFAKTHPQAVRSLLASQVRAIRWVKRDLDNLTLSSRLSINACRALSPDMPLPPFKDFVDLSLAASILSVTQIISDDDLADGRLLHNAFAFLKKERMIPAGAEWQKTRAMFDLETMAAILGEPRKWRLDEFDYDTTRGEQP